MLCHNVCITDALTLHDTGIGVGSCSRTKIFFGQKRDMGCHSHLFFYISFQASKELLEEHYADLSKKPFFPDLVAYMASGPVVPMVWEGLNAVKTGRVMLGETNPAASAPGSIRGDLCIQVGRNICHGSDAVESAKKEIGK